MRQSSLPFILSLGKAVPTYRNEQNTLAEWMLAHEGVNEAAVKKFIKQVYQFTQIQYRYSVLPDFSTGEEPLLFTDTGAEPSIASRMAVYFEAVMPLALEAANEAIEKATLEHGIAKEDITHVIAVSCTGMQAPGLDIMLVEALGLAANTERTAVNFMGCYAALHALKQAWYISRSEPEAVVLIVCAELCTLHYRKGLDRDLIASQALFADGAAAAIISQKHNPSGKALKMLDFASTLVPEGKDSMTWKMDSLGFIMHLDASIPQHLLHKMGAVVQQFADDNGLSLAEVLHCVHPGGKKILESYSQSIDLPIESLQPSFQVLAQYGNISSCTVLFVLDSIWNTAPNKPIIASAFGPGLTVELGMFQPL